jgi:hypothetical protein
MTKDHHGKKTERAKLFADLLEESPKSTFSTERYRRRPTSSRAMNGASQNRHLTVPILSCLKRD